MRYVNGGYDYDYYPRYLVDYSSWYPYYDYYYGYSPYEYLYYWNPTYLDYYYAYPYNFSYWVPGTEYVSTTQNVNSVQINTDPNVNVAQWTSLPNTAIHQGPGDAKPLYLFCRNGKPTRVADASVSTAERPVLTIDGVNYRCG